MSTGDSAGFTPCTHTHRHTQAPLDMCVGIWQEGSVILSDTNGMNNTLIRYKSASYTATMLLLTLHHTHTQRASHQSLHGIFHTHTMSSFCSGILQADQAVVTFIKCHTHTQQQLTPATNTPIPTSKTTILEGCPVSQHYISHSHPRRKDVAITSEKTSQY